jgi:hypothetical protein
MCVYNLKHYLYLPECAMILDPIFTLPHVRLSVALFHLNAVNVMFEVDVVLW